MTQTENEHAGKGHKPAKNHPWRNNASPSVRRWAREKSEVSKPNEFRFGQLKK